MAMRQLPVDFREFIVSLNSNDVRYLLIGGWAVGYYGYPRATKDIDFYVDPEIGNLKKLKKALTEFGAPEIDLTHITHAGNVFRMGRTPIQIDVIGHAAGLDFGFCYQRKTWLQIEGVPIALISKADLIQNKLETGRLTDLADVEKLQG